MKNKSKFVQSPWPHFNERAQNQNALSGIILLVQIISIATIGETMGIYIGSTFAISLDFQMEVFLSWIGTGILICILTALKMLFSILTTSCILRLCN